MKCRAVVLPICFLIACAASPATARIAGGVDTAGVAYPPLPDSIISSAGWTHVYRPALPFYCDTISVHGCYHFDTRKLEVGAGLSPYRAWWVLEHEKVHMLTGDAKLAYIGTAAQQDSIADAVANLRMLERLVTRCEAVTARTAPTP